jgi:hypothetical protein
MASRAVKLGTIWKSVEFGKREGALGKHVCDVVMNTATGEGPTS